MSRALICGDSGSCSSVPQVDSWHRSRSGNHLCGFFLNPPLSHPAAMAIGVAKTDETEDFMEAFHEFEEFEMNHQPERRKGRPETRSTHHFRTSSASASANEALMSPARNEGSSAVILDSNIHLQGTPAPAEMFGRSTATPMMKHTSASAETGTAPRLQLLELDED
ncbi:hypothetical protein DAPPUDRAFT_247594 [Daphnia pulex]|uniref:Uncharacterized protein n=1 Tax=Daphnia pulex TaxID=6669 RepID=E9GSS5_DAPPU|nr:hypothetical protein DAPPUDRAFT_247594 [Daphnia pulex]|eukprot:EFX77479.1 hypothetical protein DAPPUDRAFT_247594 [Daphnia pulex]